MYDLDPTETDKRFVQDCLRRMNDDDRSLLLSASNEAIKFDPRNFQQAGRFVDLGLVLTLTSPFLTRLGKLVSNALSEVSDTTFSFPSASSQREIDSARIYEENKARRAKATDQEPYFYEHDAHAWGSGLKIELRHRSGNGLRIFSASSHEEARIVVGALNTAHRNGMKAALGCFKRMAGDLDRNFMDWEINPR